MQKTKLVQIDPLPVNLTFDLTTLSGRMLLGSQIKRDIDTYCQLAYDDGPRTHLGASEIGDECPRRLWLKFRWCVREVFDGRMLRLFNRGHREEARFLEWLGGIDCEILDADEEQIRLVAVGGHFGGSRDGSVLLTRYRITSPLLVEFKTKGTGKAFEALLTQGVKASEAKHWAQMCVYGVSFNIKYALYFTINKNDDDLHVEVLELDWHLGQRMLDQGSAIIRSPIPPPKLYEDAGRLPCKWCFAKHVCHHGEMPLQNCRSCKNARPEVDKQWFCSRWSENIPLDKIAIDITYPCWERII